MAKKDSKKGKKELKPGTIADLQDELRIVAKEYKSLRYELYENEAVLGALYRNMQRSEVFRILILLLMIVNLLLISWILTAMA
jgi:hypothetical protein